MAEPEKYTLPQVLEIVRGHAVALKSAGAALEAVDGADATMLSLVGERALKATDALWSFEGGESPLDEAAHDAWHQTDEKGKPSALWHTLWTLPLLALAVEAATTDPYSQRMVRRGVLAMRGSYGR